MKISNKILVLSVATCLTLSPLMVSANSVELTEIKPINTEIKEEMVNEYTKYEGKIAEINKSGKSNFILVKDNEEEVLGGQVYHINDKVIILDAKTKDVVASEELKEGMKVTSYSYKFTPVAQSLPPQSTPNIIVINEGEDTGSINVSKFDEELVNVENTLKVMVSEETVIVDQAGETAVEEDLANRDLIVFYSVATRSIPAQTTAEKIILMNERKDEVVETDPEEEIEEIKVMDKIIINEKEISLDKELYKQDGTTMIPLRQISEVLGYEVKWNNDLRTVELTKGPQWTSVKIGEDNYNFAKMIVKLGAAPELKEGSTFVPFDFLEKVLNVNVDIGESGIINIVE